MTGDGTSTILAHEVTDWELCHVCDGQVDGGHVEVEGRKVYQRVDCLECEASWIEVYDAAARMEL